MSEPISFPSPAPGRNLPHSLEAEEYLLSCCMLDGAEVFPKCLEASLNPESFYDSKHGIIFECLGNLYQRGQSLDVSVVAEELRSTKQLEAVGSYAFLVQVSQRIPTTAQVGYFIDKVREQALLREVIRSATSIVEETHNFTGDIEPFLLGARQRMERIGAAKLNVSVKGIFDFKVPPPGDKSILLGNRWLNRGDGGIIVSTSGMGKSSSAIQQAILWAMGRECFGIKPNGSLRSLIFQSEDSEGDVGEVSASVAHMLNLTDAQKKEVASMVKVVSDKVHRGPKFIQAMREQIRKFKPDLVWINPLQAFMDGDIKESKDLGKFLREGLNTLNEPAAFGYILVHHTTKPNKEKDDRQWNEIMYDMAGGAELINWARFINILRPTETEGEFNLVLAKRGRRAGVVKEVQQGIGVRYEHITTIPLKHCDKKMEIPGHKELMPVIFWEERKVSPSQERAEKSPKGKRGVEFGDYASIFGKGIKAAMNFQRLSRAASGKRHITQAAFLRELESWTADGLVAVDKTNENEPKYYVNV